MCENCEEGAPLHVELKISSEPRTGPRFNIFIVKEERRWRRWWRRRKSKAVPIPAIRTVGEGFFQKWIIFKKDEK